MAEDITMQTGDLGFLSLPVGDIEDASAFKLNEVVGCPALLKLDNVQWTAKNQAAVFQAYNGIAANPFEVYTGTKQTSKKVAFSQETKQAVSYLASFGFGPYTLDDLVNDPVKYQLFANDIGGQVADIIECKAMTAFATAAAKIAVTDYAAKAITSDIITMVAKAFGKFQRQGKSLIVHPDVYTKIKQLLGLWINAGPNATIVSGDASQIGGCKIYQSTYCAVADGVYTSYIVRDAAYQYGMTAELEIAQKTERGTMEKYLDASFAYVDHVTKDTVKRVIEFTHLLTEAE